MKGKDLYAVLGVDPYATQEEIKEAWVTQLKFFHPDRFQDDEKQQKNAEERTKEVNEAYGVLSKPKKRVKYDAENQVAKPEPFVKPAVICFKNVDAGEKKEATFIVSNKGGKYERIRIQSSVPWVKVADYSSTGSDELPMRVAIEASCNDWDKSHEAHIIVKLDEEEVRVKVELQTKPKPITSKQMTNGTKNSTKSSPTKSFLNDAFGVMAKIANEFFCLTGWYVYEMILALISIAAVVGFVYCYCWIIPRFQFNVTTWSFIVHLVRDIGLTIVAAVTFGCIVGFFWDGMVHDVFNFLLVSAVVIATILSIVFWSCGFHPKTQEVEATFQIPNLSTEVPIEVVKDVTLFGSGANEIAKTQLEINVSQMRNEKLERIFVVIYRGKELPDGEFGDTGKIITADYYGMESSIATRIFHTKKVCYRAPKGWSIKSYSLKGSNNIEVKVTTKSSYHGSPSKNKIKLRTNQ